MTIPRGYSGTGKALQPETLEGRSRSDSAPCSPHTASERY